jgi:peptidoglycan/xylan/chitin deacetylase (PgdA/CDA1 family)
MGIGRSTDGTGVPVRSKEPQLDRRSAVVTALVFGLAATLLAPGTPQAAPPPAAVAPPAPAFTATAEVLNSLVQEPGADKTVVLTFDDGPDPRWTPQVLDALTRHRAVATFCLVGAKAQQHPELVRAIAAAGMRLCDHSRTHDEELTQRPADRMTGEVVDTQRDLGDAGGAPVHYFRAPGGSWSPALLQMSAGAGMQPLGWSVDPRDWKQPGIAAIVGAVQKHVQPGSIVLLHDGGGRRSQTVAALDQLLPWLAGQGYRFGFPTP